MNSTISDAASTQRRAYSSATHGVSVLVCLLAVILVCYLKLYKKVVYRLALYQVLAALLLATVNVFQIIFINYNKNLTVYRGLCTFDGWLTVYSLWVELLFAMWVTFHLFCFAVLHKNLKKLEVLYVVTSLLVPAVIASVPLMTHIYGLSPLAACYIYGTNGSQNTALIERFALWDGPAMALLLAASIAMVAILIKLTYRVFCNWRFEYESISDGDQFWKALKQLLPLAAFPILFFLFIIPNFIFHLYLLFNSPSEAIYILNLLFTSLWTMSSGGTLLLHIAVVRLCSRKNLSMLSARFTSTGNPTVRLVSSSSANSDTSAVTVQNSLVSSNYDNY